MVLFNLRGCFIRDKEYIVIDKNGEIREEFSGKRVVGLEDGDRVIRRASVEYLKAREEGKIRYALRKASGYINCLSETFVKVNDFELECIVESLDVYEKAMLMTMLPYVRYDCSVKKLNGSPIKMKELVKLSKMSQRKAYAVINTLVNKFIVRKIGDVYYVNPWLFYRGNKIDKELKDMFGDYLVRCKDMTPWKELN